MAEIGGQQLRMIAPNGLRVKIDQDVYVDLDLSHSLFFDSESKDFMARYNEAEIRRIAEPEEEG